MADNAVTLVGALGADPVLRSGARGDWATFSLATNARWKDPQGKWVDGPTSWFDVSADGSLGRNAAACLTKGQRVVVHGTVTVKDSPREGGGRDRYVQVRATAVGPDLMFGTTVFTRATSQSTPEPLQQQTAAPSSAAPATEERGGDWGGPRETVPVGAPQPEWGGAGLGEGDDVPF